ncbi:hypothetical protein L1987_57975 [Smallanthus sonchifolius]|uniref:Uncharacterized protein n=1 Tax=Smallanthus sonchifolius TaxID=185202 RepID=A0ACB9DDY4_9ASTR|nr:hypothetical protein L1987_57975 [Smallanthus sonchifolius]
MHSTCLMNCSMSCLVGGFEYLLKDCFMCFQLLVVDISMDSKRETVRNFCKLTQLLVVDISMDSKRETVRKRKMYVNRTYRLGPLSYKRLSLLSNNMRAVCSSDQSMSSSSFVMTSDSVRVLSSVDVPLSATSVSIYSSLCFQLLVFDISMDSKRETMRNFCKLTQVVDISMDSKREIMCKRKMYLNRTDRLGPLSYKRLSLLSNNMRAGCSSDQSTSSSSFVMTSDSARVLSSADVPLSATSVSIYSSLCFQLLVVDISMDSKRETVRNFCKLTQLLVFDISMDSKRETVRNFCKLTQFLVVDISMNSKRETMCKRKMYLNRTDRLGPLSYKRLSLLSNNMRAGCSSDQSTSSSSFVMTSDSVRVLSSVDVPLSATSVLIYSSL